jgi:ABC-type transporter Mla subunit MlaD
MVATAKGLVRAGAAAVSMASPLAAIDRLRRLRERIIARVREVNKTTEDDVLAAGRHVQRVVEVAHRHIARLRDVLAGPVGNEDSDLARAIRSQSDHVRQHVSSVGKAVSEHAGQVAAVAEQVRSITAAAREIERLNSAARVLSINARIEASRSSGSSVFSTIAHEMQQLSKAIAAANKTVYELANAMDKTIPQLQRQSQSLARVVETYSIEARDRIDAVDRRVEELRAAVGTTLAESDTALAEIVTQSHAALSKLQFQDVCAQGLLQIDGWTAEAQRQVASDFGVDGAVAIAPAAHTTVTNEDVEVDRREAGEVMLF